jgi:hypothetical protein
VSNWKHTGWLHASYQVEKQNIFSAVFRKFIFIFLNPENGYKAFVAAELFYKHYSSAKILLYYTCSEIQKASDSIVHEQLFSSGVKRYLFQPLFKNTSKKSGIQKGGFSICIPIFIKV